MKGLKIYYLEDEKTSFDFIKTCFEAKGLEVFPSSDEDWSSEITQVVEYLQSNQEEKEKNANTIKQIFLKNKVDLLLFDFYLEGTEYNSGELYKDLIKKDNSFIDIPVLFFSVETNTQYFDIDSNSSYVEKEYPFTHENINEIYTRIEREALIFPIIKKKLFSK